MWDALFHLADTNVPSLVAGKPISFLPFAPLFQGFIAKGEAATWSEELDWYSRLSPEDNHLWNSSRVFQYAPVLHYSPEYGSPGDGERTSIPEPIRERLRAVDRQRLVDFVNTLSFLGCNTDCEELWNADFDFWTRYTLDHLFISQFYLDELDLSMGIELEESSWEAAKKVLDYLTWGGHLWADKPHGRPRNSGQY